MKKITLSKWAEREFHADSIPSGPTLRALASKGSIPGAVRFGGRWYVEESAPVVSEKSGITEKVNELVGGDAELAAAVAI